MYMKELKFIIPTSLSEVTLGDYLMIQKMLDDEKDEVKLASKLISTMCGLTDTEVRGLNKGDYDDIYTQLKKTLNQKSKLITRTKIGGVDYGLIPNFDTMSFGEYIDLDRFIKKPEHLPNVMNILFRPITDESNGRYRIQEYTGEEDVEIMNDITMDVVQGVLVFFYHLGNELLRVIPRYLQEAMDKDTQLKQTLEQNGLGTQAYMDSLRETLESLMSTHGLESVNV